MSYEAPYAGLKVIDVSQGVAGPYCAMMLAQYGANVIKVEPTDTGDWARDWGRNTAITPRIRSRRTLANARSHLILNKPVAAMCCGG